MRELREPLYLAYESNLEGEHDAMEQYLRILKGTKWRVRNMKITNGEYFRDEAEHEGYRTWNR